MTPISSTTILNDIKHAPAFAEEIVKVLDVDTLLDTTAARLVWSIAIEPGDQIAGALTAALGPIAALEILLKSASEKGFLQNLLQELRRTETEDKTPASPQRPCADPELLWEENSETLSGLSPKQLCGAWRRWKPRLDMIPYVAMLKVAQQQHFTLLTPEHPMWPAQLSLLGTGSPQTLWVKGDCAALSRPGLAVVGARAITRYGEEVTAELTQAGVRAGAMIVSGAAYGVDAAAHRVALQSGAPTVAVLAGGSDRPYPMAHANLLAEIVDAGAVCSEVPPGTAPTRWRFLQRNRIIAALSQATLVTEAGMRSGAINTAGHTAEIGNPLGAVPGPITSPASTGCHRLIREYNAEVITNGAQVRALAGLDDGMPDTQYTAQSHTSANFDTESALKSRTPSKHVRVLDSLPFRGRLTIQQISQRSGLDENEVTLALAEMELIGSVKTVFQADQKLWSLVR